MAEPNSITESERRLSNSYAPQFFADKGRRETDEQHRLTRFADFKALQELLELQAGERACLAYMERNGSYKRRVVEYLRSSVDARETEIRNLRANDRWLKKYPGSLLCALKIPAAQTPKTKLAIIAVPILYLDFIVYPPLL